MKLTKTILISSVALLAPFVSAQQRGSAVPLDYNDNTGWQSMFDGKTLTGWEGPPNLWDVSDGAIHIDTACGHPTGTTYIYWTGGEPADFILKYDMKGTGNVNGGMQFRSFLSADPTTQKYPPPAGRGGGGGRGGSGGGGRGGSGGFGAFGGSGRGGGGRGAPVVCATPPPPAPTAASLAKWDLHGYQVDFDANNQWGGNIYEQRGRNVITTPGHALLAEPGKPVEITATLADKATLDSWFNKNDYNHFMVIARGNTLSTFMNGHLIMILVDNDPNYFRAKGKIAPEVESTGEYWVKNIFLKTLN